MPGIAVDLFRYGRLRLLRKYNQKRDGIPLHEYHGTTQAVPVATYYKA
jgi:hypothetical protein